MSASSYWTHRTPSGEALAAHLQQAAGWALLTAAEEVELGAAIEVGVLARNRLDADHRAADAADLAVLVAVGDRAMTRMVAANLRLVLMVARGHRTPAVPLIDLVQEGTLGLVRAVQKFDHRRGVKFSTYAVWWIRQAVQRGHAELVRSVRLPVVTSEQLRMVRAARHRLEALHAREVSDAELAEATGFSIGRVRHLVGVDSDVVQLDAPRPADDGLHTQLSTPDVLVDISSRTLTEARVQDALAVLGPQERQVLERRYGLVGQPLSAAQVGACLGLTESRVRTLERHALRRLRGHPALLAVVA